MFHDHLDQVLHAMQPSPLADGRTPEAGDARRVLSQALRIVAHHPGMHEVR